MHMEVREMERYASSLKMKEIKRLAQEKQYLKAMKILESMNVDKIRSMSDLSVIAEILIHNDEYEDAMEILLRIYEKSCSRRIIEQLIDLSIVMKNMEETKEFYNEYLRIAPRDPYRLVLRYRIEKANHMPYVQRIETLEQLKQEDYMEEWAYELAKLYHKTGQVDKCVDECSDIILWFGQGIVVEKARLLKEHYTSGFNITDNLGAGEFDATRSLEEVIRQVKMQRGVSQPATVSSPSYMDSTVLGSSQTDNEALYPDSGKATNIESDYTDLVEVEIEPEVKENVVVETQSLAKETIAVDETTPVEEPAIEESAVEEESTNYVLTPEVVKKVRARVNARENAVVKVKECEQELEKAEDKLQDPVQEESHAEITQAVESAQGLGEDAVTEVGVISATTDMYGSQKDITSEKTKKLEEVDEEEKLTEDKTLPEDETLSEDKILPEEEKLTEDKTLPEEEKLAEDKTLPEEEKLAEDKTLPEDETLSEEKELTQESTEELPEDNKETPQTEPAHALTKEELQKMKERMQQLQEYDITKTYRHDSNDIYEDGENTYAYGINLNTIFQNFIYNESIKKQLLSILENMDNSKQCNNFMVCGDIQTGKTSLARAIAIAMWKLNRIPTKKVAKISASKLNQINLLEKMEQLADGSLVIENASLLNANSVKSIIQMIEHFDGRILVLFEDSTRNMEELMMKEEALRRFFTHRIIIPRYNAEDVTGFAYSMVKQQEYEVEDNSRRYFAEKIEQICRITPYAEQLARIKVYVGELIKRAETRNMLLLMKQAKEGKFSQKVTNVITIDDIAD